MRSMKEFDQAFEKLNQELNNMTGEVFFAMFGLSLDDLPSECQASKEVSIGSNCFASEMYPNVDLKCA